MGKISVSSMEMANKGSWQVQQVGPEDSEKGKELISKPTLKRYLILLLFCLTSGNKAFQYMHIPACTSKMSQYYGVDNLVVNTLAVLFMVAFVPFGWPACYLIKRIGLRKTILSCAFLLTVASILKCFSCQEHRIYLLFIGQILVSLAEQLVFSVPTRLASVWFPDAQVSTAVAVCILGNQFFLSLGFIIPQAMLEDYDTNEQIGQQTYLIYLASAVISAILLLANLVLFDDAPKYPPGTARLKQIEQEQHEFASTTFWQSVKDLGKNIKEIAKNRDYNILAVSYGIIIAIGFTVHSVLNQMLGQLYPGDDMLIGTAGFLMIVSGAVALPIWGRLLDGLHRYLFLNIVTTAGTTMSLAVFAYVVTHMDSHLAIYIVSVSFGVFQTGMYATGLELATELTYPMAELVTSSYMNIHPHVFCTIFIYISSYLVDNYGEFYTNVFNMAVCVVALVLLFAVKETLKRQEAIRSGTKGIENHPKSNDNTNNINIESIS